MPKPSLELAVEVTAASGTQYRWGSGRRAGEVPQGLSFKTKQSEGFADGGVTLARRIDREYVDLNLLDSVVISGADGSIAYEGRVAALPRSMQQTHSVSVQLVGWMAHARDRKLQEVYVDRDLSGWGSASATRKSGLTIANYKVDDGQVAPDTTNNAPALRLSVVGPWASPFKVLSVAAYDAGSGNRIAQLYYDRSTFNGIGIPDANWIMEFLSSDTDTMTSPSVHDFQSTLANFSGYITFSIARRFLEAHLYYNVTPGGVTDQTYEVFIKNLAVYGDHGIPLIGSDPKGVAASDVIKHVVDKYCPALNTDGVQSTSYPIPHLVFKDRTDPYDVFLEVNKYHLWQLAVYDNRTLSYGPVDMSDYDWEVRLSDFGTTVDLQGDSTSTLANGIVVQYQDVATGRQNVLTPDDYIDLKDPNDSNPATLAGLNVWTELSLSSPTTQDAALQLGRAALAEWNQPKSPGTINVQGHIRDRAGHYQPVWKVRAGDRIIISDHANDRPRLVVETDYTHDSKSMSIAVDSSFKRLDAVLDRLGTALRAANLAA